MGRWKGLNKLRLRTRTRISCRAFISLEVADSRLLPKCKMGSFIEFIFHSALKKIRTRCQTLQRISFVAVSRGKSNKERWKKHEVFNSRSNYEVIPPSRCLPCYLFLFPSSSPTDFPPNGLNYPLFPHL